MTAPDTEFPMTAETLAAETRALRSLARSLVNDEHVAEDAVQDAWVCAIEKAPGHGFGLGAWLAGVTKNRVREQRRTRRRRLRLEQSAAAPETAPSAADQVECIDTLRSVLLGVRELADPYRSVVMMRFFNDLSVAEVARRRGVPEATVRTHLRRGLARLRERLDRERGERYAWSVPLLPFVRSGAEAAEIVGAIGIGNGLAGRVVDGRTGEPIGKFSIRIVTPRLEPGDRRGRGYGMTWSREGLQFDGKDGCFSTGNENLTPGAIYAIEARAKGYAPTRVDHVPATVDPHSDALTIALHTGTALVGRVLADDNGKPVADATVKLVRPGVPIVAEDPDDTHDRIMTRTDAGGGFRFEGRFFDAVVAAFDTFAFLRTAALFFLVFFFTVFLLAALFAALAPVAALFFETFLPCFASISSKVRVCSSHCAESRSSSAVSGAHAAVFASSTAASLKPCLTIGSR